MNRIQEFKQDIKNMVVIQRATKGQRKTDYFKGDRTVSPLQAQELHRKLRITLRSCYVAYGLLRGRTLEQIENKSDEPVNMDAVDLLMQKYTDNELVQE